MADKTGREQRFHFMKASVLLGHADEPHALDPQTGSSQQPRGGLANRYIGRLVPRLMEDANQLFSAGNAQNMEPSENVLPLFERLGYNS